MKSIYKLHWDCYRMGDIEGVFVAEDESIKNLMNKIIRFGEVLGKHSDVHGPLEEKDIIKVISEDEDKEFVEKFIKLGLSTGYNPLHYYEEPDYE